MPLMSAQEILHPPLVRRPWGLLVDEAHDLQLQGTRWMDGGITFVPLGCGPLEAVCNDDACDDSNLPGPLDVDDCPVFVPFDIYASEQADTLNYQIDELTGRLDTRFAVQASPVITETLVNNIFPFAEMLGAGYSAIEGLSLVETYLGQTLQGGLGTVLVNPGTLALLHGRLPFIDGRYRTPGGHTLISDPGVDHETMVGCGEVVFNIGPPRMIEEDANQYLDRTRNTITARRIARAVVAADPCSAVALGLDVPQPGGS